MKLWDDFREWLDTVEPFRVTRADTKDAQSVIADAVIAARGAQQEFDAQIALSFARKGKGAQGVQRAMAVRIANAIRKGAA